MPRVSVIIPTCNRAYFLRQAIESVLSQTFSDFELIVVDDGSTDATPYVLQRWEKEIRWVRQENCGVSRARNVGIRAARGIQCAHEDRVDASFVQPSSGLSAAAYDAFGTRIWSTLSSAAKPPSMALAVDQWEFRQAANAEDRFVLGYGIRWHFGDKAFHFTIQVAESAKVFFAAETEFARRLWLWLTVPAGLLLMLQLVVLNWALRPMQHMAAELRDLEQGRKGALDSRYPQELSPLARAVNALLSAESTRRLRYQNALADLSHSLKTPLAAARSLLDKLPRETADEPRAQLQQMDRIIRFQLSRATAQAPAAFLPSIAAAPVIGRLCDTIGKVYREKQLSLTWRDDTECSVRIGEDELFEVIGNLLDNACKWARHKVHVELVCSEAATHIYIDDDGPGFPDEDLARWLERGTRADHYREGQGLGLAAAHDILMSAGGELKLDRSPLGGARIEVRIPR